MLKFTAGSNKGATQQGDVFNSPFSLGQVRGDERIPFDSNYTSSQVVTDGTTSETGAVHMHWSPVVPGTIDLTIGGKRYIDYNDTLYEIPAGYSVSRSANTCEQSVNVDVVVTDATGAVVDITTLTPLSGAKVVYSTNANDKSEIGISGLTASTAYTLKYSYNNQYIP